MALSTIARWFTASLSCQVPMRRFSLSQLTHLSTTLRMISRDIRRGRAGHLSFDRPREESGGGLSLGARINRNSVIR